MTQTLPAAAVDMLETPPGYPFEEIDYVDIEVEEVSPCNATTVLSPATI